MATSIENADMMLAEEWWTLALRGVLAIIVGLIALFFPGVTLAAFVLLFAAYMLVDGIFALIAGFRAARRHERSWPLFLEGVADILAGVIAFFWPGITLLVLVFLVGFWAIFSGVGGLPSGWRARMAAGPGRPALGDLRGPGPDRADHRRRGPLLVVRGLRDRLRHGAADPRLPMARARPAHRAGGARCLGAPPAADGFPRDPARIPVGARSRGKARMSAASQGTAFQPPAAEILMSAGDGVMAADEDGHIVLCNRAAEEIFGYAADEILGRSIETLMAEPARRAHRHLSEASSGPGLAAPVERRRLVGRRKHGGEVPLEATLSRRAIEGRTVLIAIVRDATEREAERLLARELEHRMKNALATVQALAVHTLRGNPSPEAFIDTFSGRLAALAHAHSLLMQHYQDSVPLHDLLAQQLDPYRSSEPGRVVVTGEAVALRPAAALSLNLVLHELTTNAVKYGALSVPAGRVEVSWRLEGPAGARRLVLAWREAGSPEARPPTGAALVAS
jgi:PAS domain S-box-containing protein